MMVKHHGRPIYKYEHMVQVSLYPNVNTNEASIIMMHSKASIPYNITCIALATLPMINYSRQSTS